MDQTAEANVLDLESYTFSIFDLINFLIAGVRLPLTYGGSECGMAIVRVRKSIKERP
jgi:hypothetical protein